MNSTSVYIFNIYQISLYVRDTLHYTVPGRDETYLTEHYKRRGESLRRLIGEGTPFAAFLRANEEKAPKINESVNRLINDVYSEDSRIMRVVGDLVEVDHSQHISIYELVVGIYQTLDDILRGYITHAKKENTFEQQIEDVVNAGEYYFRALAHHAIVGDVAKFYFEYSQAMQEAKGEKNPVAQFISEDLKKLYDLVKFMSQYNKVKDATYWEMADEVQTVLTQITGQRAIPEGKTIPELFNHLGQTTLRVLQDAESKWHKVFVPVHDKYIKYIEKQMKKEQNGKEG